MIVQLKRFEIIGSLLFIDGIGIIKGVSAKAWSDVSYELIFEGEKTYQKALAKSHHPELTEHYAQNGENYDKCWFTTKAYVGVEIGDIALGEYRLSLKIITPSTTKIAPLSASDFANAQFDLTDDKLTLRSHQEQVPITPFHSEKFAITGNYADSNGNVIDTKIGSSSACFARFVGKNNRLIIHPKANLKNAHIEFMMDNAVVEISENVRMTGNWRIGQDCTINIGKNSSSTNPVYITCAESSRIIIGEDCMFATNNQIRTDDAHPIYDVNTGKRINFSKDIVLGNHVWIGFGAMLLGGAKVGDGSVIGANSLVNKSHPNNSIIAGTPAKTIKHDVFWERAPLLVSSPKPQDYTLDELQHKSYCQKTQLDSE